MKNLIILFLIFSFPISFQAQSIQQSSEVPFVYINDCFFRKDKPFIPAKYLNILKFQENLAPIKIIDTLGFSSRGRTGFVNTSGEIVIPPRYDSVYKHFHKGIAQIGVIGEDGEMGKGIINKKNISLVPPIFEEIGEIRNDLVLVKDKLDLWGFYNTTSQQLSKPAYESIKFFRKDFFLVSYLGKRGVIDHNGRHIVPLEYKDIIARKDASLELRKFSSYMIKNFKNEITNQLDCDSVMPQQTDLYKYAINGKYGIIKSQVISSPVYDFISPYLKNNAVVRKGNKYGMIDTAGKVILPLIYDMVQVDTLGLVYIKGTKAKQFGSYFIQDKKKSWAVLDSNLKTVIPFLYKEIQPMGDSIFAVMNEEDKWGYVNYKDKLIVPFKYDFAKPFKNGFASVGIKEPYKKVYWFINKKGEEAVATQNHHVFAAGIGRDSSDKIVFNFPYNSFHKFSFINGSFVKVKYGYKYGVANKQSDLIVSIDYDSVIFSPGETCFIVYKDRQVGIFGAAGDTVHPLTDKYDRIFPYKEGYAKVIKDGRFGCIDYHKNRRISVQYPQLLDIQEGMIGMVINEKWGFLDRNEALKVQPYYVEVKPFKNGIARVRTGQYWDFVDKEGKIQNSALYQAIEETGTGKWILTYNGKKGMGDERGREMLVPRYQHVKDLGQGYIQVWKDGKTGVVNYDQNFILPIEHSNLTFDPVNNNFIIHEPGAIEKKELANNLKQK